MRKILFTLVLLLPFLAILAQDIGGDYYVATDGKDTNPGTYDQPFGTWQKAFQTAEAGDTVYFRGGVWYPTKQSSLSQDVVYYDPSNGYGHDGKYDAPIVYMAYPGEKPVLDCSKVDLTGKRYNGGIQLYNVDFVVIDGLEIRNVYQKTDAINRASGLNSFNGSNTIYKNLIIHDISGAGLYHLANDLKAIGYDTTRFINCDIYNLCDSLNADPENIGNFGDCIKADFYLGAYVEVTGCRFWDFCDDACDISGSAQGTINNCWAWNGANRGYGLGTGGIKFGGTRQNIGKTVQWKVYNNLSWNMNGSGFFNFEYVNSDDGYYRSNSEVFNNIAYQCTEGGFQGSDNALYPIITTTYRNNIVYDVGIYYLNDLGLYVYYPEDHNNWDHTKPPMYGGPYNYYTDSVKTTDADFMLTASNPSDSAKAYAQLSAPRVNNELPYITFLRLAEGSDLINAGVDVGLPYVDKPDLGAFEFDKGSPVPSFTATPNPANINIDINFDASASTDDGTITSYDWIFGDGNTGTGVTTTHSYNQAGSYTAQLTVTDNDGNTAIVSKLIIVNNKNVIPTPSFTASPNPVDVGANIIFNASASSDDGNITTYAWNFGDGNTANGVSTTYSFTQAGSFTVKLTVTDNDGNKASTSKLITVNNVIAPVIPTASFTVTPNPVSVGANIIFNASASSDDGTITSYEWNFGDGNTANGVTTTYSYTQPGSFTAILSVTDNDGNKASISKVITVNNITEPVVPTASFTVTPNPVIVGANIIFNASSSSDNGTITSYEWNFGDGNTANGVTTTYSYTQSGSYTAILSVTDNDGNTATTSKIIQVNSKVEPVNFEILNSFPNPTTDLMVVEFNCPTNNIVRVRVYDETNHAVLRDSLKDVQIGQNKLILNLSSLQKGIYKVTLENKSTEINANITKQ